MRYPVDCSSTSAVVLCPVCGWRTIDFDRLGALRAARAHELRAHPGETAARNLLGVAEHRARKATPPEM